MQRFLRLRCEIGELMDDLDSMAESTRESSHSEGLSIQVKTLSKQLEACQVDSEVDTGSSGNVGVDALTKQIDALKKTSGSKAAEDDGSGVYQVFLTSENQGTIDVADLDARLVALEKVMGSNSGAGRRVLSAPTDNQNLARSMRVLEERRTFLRPQHIDHVEGRLAALTFKINSITEQAAAVESASREDKLHRAAELVAGQSSMAAGLLPDLVTRMQAVAELQEAAKTWADMVDSVQQQQRETKDVIKDTEKAVSETREYFDKNITGIYDNCNLLQSKLQEIK